jgi:D-mannonate dehydratase
MPKWQYIVEVITASEKWGEKRQAKEIENFQHRLNEMGQEGWEMISYESVPLLGTFSKNLKGYAYLCFFKKQL